MDANKENMLEFLEGKKQFVLPIFQRRYSWTKEQCSKLWDDVVRVGGNEETPSYFLGSIVSIGDGGATVPKFLVIDGQQRLTTLSLLLMALGRTINLRNVDIRLDGIRIDQDYLADYVFNPREDGERRFKQLLTQHDRDTLIQLLESGEASDRNSLLVENLRFFEDKLKRANLEVVYKGIKKLIIVDIALDSGTDNPQLIFESLNAKALPLSQADLIRNFVLMGQEHNAQTRLYENYWYPMEQRFGDEYSKRFDLFIRDYLTLKTGQIPNTKKVYESFKRYVDDKRRPEALEKEIREIVRYSEYYVRIVLLQEPDRDIRACFKDIKTLDVAVAYPFLLGVYGDYADKQLQKEEIIEVTRLVESYVFRRTICDIPRNTLNKTFAGIMGRIDKNKYVHSLKIALSRMTGRQLFPLDNDFQREFQSRNMYDLDTCNYLLEKLENYERKETVSAKDFTIEHIMPQTLSDEWQEELGENWIDLHERYLHTIGNLTLTGYNPELSNASFKEKLEITGGFRDSPLRLNASLRNVERWDEAVIVERSEILAEKACKIWPDHGVRPESDAAKKRAWTLADHRHLINEKLELFQQLRTRILHLDASVSEKINQHTIAYRTNTIFVDVVPQARRLRLSLNLPYPTVKDPEGWCKDVTNLGRWGTGDVEVGISSVGDLDYIMSLIRQAYERHIADQT